MPQQDLEPFVGRWKITEMDMWSRDVIDEYIPAEIVIRRNGLGHLQFIAVQGGIDCRANTRHGHVAIEWSWMGVDGNRERSGRGWCILLDDGTMEGMFYFHEGDESGFRAERE